MIQLTVSRSLAAYQTINPCAAARTPWMQGSRRTSTANMDIATPGDGYGIPSSVNCSGVIGAPGLEVRPRPASRSAIGTNVSVDVCYLLLQHLFPGGALDGQFSISPGPFSAPGDSACPSCRGGRLRRAAVRAGGDGLTIATPIDVVPQRFGVTIDGQPPGDGPPSAPTA